MANFLNMVPLKNASNWDYVDSEPIENLEKYKDHHRLQVFYYKGLKCALCNNEVGTYLGHYKDKSGGIHIDVYTDNHLLMNVDHIIPKSKGGSNNLDNLQPSCVKCNCKKGNNDTNKQPPQVNSINIYVPKFEKGDLVRFKHSSYNKGTKELYEVVCEHRKGRKYKSNGKYKGRPVVVELIGESGNFHVLRNQIIKVKSNKNE